MYDSGWPELVLKRVRVHRVEAESERGAVFRKALVVVGAIPGKMQRDRGSCAGQLVDDGAVLEFLEYVARLAGPGNRPKRVPPVPTPHEGTATLKLATARVISSILMPRRSSWVPSAV